MEHVERLALSAGEVVLGPMGSVPLQTSPVLVGWNEPRHSGWSLPIRLIPLVDITKHDKVAFRKCPIAKAPYRRQIGPISLWFLTLVRTRVSARPEPEPVSRLPLVSIDDDRVSLRRTQLDLSDRRTVDGRIVRFDHFELVVVDRHDVVLLSA